ncbi:hypothetical protein [Actinokineospora inagensis]|uniref:hypothetical protein n=1 Tax=Actinokineospora inagensis TaxID=103730 RepID=UPI0012F9611E|nr:hypothetical protein [Actinokineospora inagensis]
MSGAPNTGVDLPDVGAGVGLSGEEKTGAPSIGVDTRAGAGLLVGARLTGVEDTAGAPGTGFAGGEDAAGARSTVVGVAGEATTRGSGVDSPRTGAGSPNIGADSSGAITGSAVVEPLDTAVTIGAGGVADTTGVPELGVLCTARAGARCTTGSVRGPDSTFRLITGLAGDGSAPLT